MTACCGKKPADTSSCDPCNPPEPACGGTDHAGGDKPAVLAWFDDMAGHCYELATKAKDAGRPVVGIMCEYTPRELIMAAGGLPVCLCGGSAETIPAAEDDLPANLCPLIKSTYGYSVNKANPFLEMADLLVAETTCDGKKKMYELLARRHPMHVLELPQKPDDADAFLHWVKELHRLREVLGDRLGTEITDDALRDAIRKMNRERALRRRLAAVMQADSPPITGRQLLDLKSLISCLPADIEQYEKILAELESALPDETACTNRVRVLLTGVPLPHGAERVMEILEDSGGLVVCQENCTGLKPIVEDIDEDAQDPLLALAEKYFHLPCSVMTPNTRRIDLLRELARDYRAECVVELIWQACLTYDVESKAVKEFVTEKLGVPYLRIETDYSPSDSARIAVRVEALYETVRGRCGG